MKTKINRLLLGSCLVLLACLCSCDDYLSNVPKGQKIPTTLNDFSVMLADAQRSLCFGWQPVLL